MYPVLFSIGGIQVHSYYVLWTFALCCGVAWARRRMGILYGMEDDQARRILLVVFLGMLAGARVGGMMGTWEIYRTEPMKLLRFWEGALSAVPAFLGAGAAGILSCRRHGVPVWKVADAGSIPAAFVVAFGRWGCFLNGCCSGKGTSLPWGVRFPGDPLGLARHPVQLYYALSALFILGILQRIEARFLSVGEDRRIQGAVLWPLFMIFYSLVRLFLDPFREEFGDVGLQEVRILSGAVLASGAAWLLHSLFFRKKEGVRQGNAEREIRKKNDAS